MAPKKKPVEDQTLKILENLGVIRINLFLIKKFLFSLKIQMSKMLNPKYQHGTASKT